MMRREGTSGRLIDCGDSMPMPYPTGLSCCSLPALAITIAIAIDRAWRSPESRLFQSSAGRVCTDAFEFLTATQMYPRRNERNWALSPAMDEECHGHDVSHEMLGEIGSLNRNSEAPLLRQLAPIEVQPDGLLSAKTRRGAF